MEVIDLAIAPPLEKKRAADMLEQIASECEMREEAIREELRIKENMNGDEDEDDD